jgi:hypothetical protein
VLEGRACWGVRGAGGCGGAGVWTEPLLGGGFSTLSILHWGCYALPGKASHTQLIFKAYGSLLNPFQVRHHCSPLLLGPAHLRNDFTYTDACLCFQAARPARARRNSATDLDGVWADAAKARTNTLAGGAAEARPEQLNRRHCM